MICGKCGLDNPASEMYCRRCGGKITFRDIEVQMNLKAKLREEQEAALEAQTRQALVAAICLFLLALTLKSLFSSWSEMTCFVVPSSSANAPHTQVRFIHLPPIEAVELEIPK